MQYVGEDYLTALEKAKNYNAFIVSRIVAWLRKDDRWLLDFGAGNGMLARMVEEASGKEVSCLEPAVNMRKYLRGDVWTSLDELPDASIDFIYSSNVLEHIEDDVSVVSEMARVLKDKGRVVLYLPALKCLFTSLDKKVGHYRRYDMQMLGKLFDPVQWSVKELRYADFLGFFATLWFKVFGNKSGDYPSAASLVIYDRIVFPVSRLFDHLSAGRIFGKNVVLCAEKRGLLCDDVSSAGMGKEEAQEDRGLGGGT